MGRRRPARVIHAALEAEGGGGREQRCRAGARRGGKTRGQEMPPDSYKSKIKCSNLSGFAVEFVLEKHRIWLHDCQSATYTRTGECALFLMSSGLRPMPFAAVQFAKTQPQLACSDLVRLCPVKNRESDVRSLGYPDEIGIS